MTNYTKATNFAAKDSLASGNAAKVVKGTEIDTEFTNIETAVNSKSDSANPVFTGVAEFDDGSASAPSITNTADTNTGLFFPAADTIALTTGGSERLRLDSAGNMGLGVTPSAWSGAVPRALQVGPTASFAANSDGTTQFTQNAYYNGSDWKYIANGYSQRIALSLVDGSISFNNAASGTAAGTVTFTQAMTLDASGNLLLGGTSNASGARLLSENAAGNQLGLRYTGIATWYNSIDSSGNYIWTKDGSEKARIDSSGNLLVGTTSTSGVGTSILSNNGQCLIVQNTSTTSANTMTQFRNPNGIVGQIICTGSSTAYNTSSDYRLKENIAPMTGALAKVAALKPVTYTWKVDGSEGEGFIAHELQEVVAGCVSGEKDAVDADGNPVYQGIDTSFLVATLTAAIQELNAKFEAYKAAHP